MIDTTIGRLKNPTDRFFAYAREKHLISTRRALDKPFPWSDDLILQTYKFTNVSRELDKTTVWFRGNAREQLRAEPEVLLATVVFRWFNRIESGEVIFCQKDALSSGPELGTVWDMSLLTGCKSHIKHAVKTWCGSGPYVTGAYMIKTPTGMKKLDGVCWCINNFTSKESPSWKGMANACLNGTMSLKEVWKWLCQIEFLGPFLAYEIVTDLRHTDLLCNAPDIDTWANPGPGALRESGRLADLGERIDSRGIRRPVSESRSDCMKRMHRLLSRSRDNKY